MKVSGGGFDQCYNGQIAVDMDSLLIVTTGAVQACNDKQQVVPALEQLKALPTELGQLVNLVADIPDLIQCALMHVQFETIHPFLDGNGRVGRLLITFFLLERKRLSQPLLYLSAYIDTHKTDYYELLQRVRTHGEWSPWLRFFLHGVSEVATSAGLQAKELRRLREEYRAILRDKPNALIVLDELFVNPYMTIFRASKILSKSHPTAKAAISVLEQKRVLKEVARRQWGKYYVSQPILEALEKPLA